MPVFRRPSLSLALGLACFFFGKSALAYCRTHTCDTTASHTCQTDADDCITEGLPIAWKSACIGFALNERGTAQLDVTQAKSVILKSFAQWSDVGCPGGGKASFTFSPMADVPCHRSGYDPKGPNVNVVLFQDSDWTYRGIDGTLAKTAVTFDHDTGEILDADIEINAAFNALTITDDPAKVKYDLESIVTHEAGHFLGLAHSADSTAVMFSTYNPGEMSLRKLTPDDVQGICEAYPPGRAAACDPSPHGGLTTTCPEPKKSGGCNVGGSDLPAGSGALPVLSVLWFVRKRARA